MIPIPDRFSHRIKVTDDGHWLWCTVRRNGPYPPGTPMRSKDKNRYTVAHIDGKLRHPTRYIWEMTMGPIPAGMILRRCKDRTCVNPNHCRLSTWEEVGDERRTDHCIRGHAWTEENTRHRDDGGRTCRECDRLRQQRNRDRKRGLV